MLSIAISIFGFILFYLLVFQPVAKRIKQELEVISLFRQFMKASQEG